MKNKEIKKFEGSLVELLRSARKENLLVDLRKAEINKKETRYTIVIKENQGGEFFLIKTMSCIGSTNKKTK